MLRGDYAFATRSCTWLLRLSQSWLGEAVRQRQTRWSLDVGSGPRLRRPDCKLSSRKLDIVRNTSTASTTGCKISNGKHVSNECYSSNDNT